MNQKSIKLICTIVTYYYIINELVVLSLSNCMQFNF